MSTEGHKQCTTVLYSGFSIIRTPLATVVWICVRIIEIVQIMNSIIVAHAQLNDIHV